MTRIAWVMADEPRHFVTWQWKEDDDLWRACCSCGRYQSGLSIRPRAEAAWRDHVAAVEGES